MKAIQQKIYIVAPGYGCSRSNLLTVENFLKKEFPKFKIITNKDLLYDQSSGMEPALHMPANYPKLRAKCIIDAINDSHADFLINPKQKNLIWCLTGGEGASEIIEELRHVELKNSNAWMAGFSDSTSLMIFLGEKGAVYPLYAPDLLNVCEIIAPGYKHKIAIEEELALLKKILNSDTDNISYHITPVNKIARASTEIAGYALGGVMASLYCSLGTHWEFDPRNKILFAEGITEPFELLRIKKALFHEKFITLVRQSKAIVFGDLSPLSLKKPYTPADYAWSKAIVIEFAQYMEQFNIPVFQGLPNGHTGINEVGFSGKALPLPFCEASIVHVNHHFEMTFHLQRPFAPTKPSRKKPGELLAMENPAEHHPKKYVMPKKIQLNSVNQIELSFQPKQPVELLGGNLHIVHETIATRFQLDCQNKILLLEFDQSKKDQPMTKGHVNIFMRRTLTHFLQAGLFNGIKALVIGNIKIKINVAQCLNDLTEAVWTKNKENDNEFHAKHLLNDKANLDNIRELEASKILHFKTKDIIVIDDLEKFLVFYNRRLLNYVSQLLQGFATARKISFPIYITEPYAFNFPELFTSAVSIEKTAYFMELVPYRPK